MGQPTAEDLRWGASRVELYKCDLCGIITRFPRYNDRKLKINTLLRTNK